MWKSSTTVVFYRDIGNYIVYCDVVAEKNMTGTFFGVSIPDTVDLTKSQVDLKSSYSDKAEVMKVLKEFKTARFKMFKTEEEAVKFSGSSAPTNSISSEISIVSFPPYQVKVVHSDL